MLPSMLADQVGSPYGWVQFSIATCDKKAGGSPDKLCWGIDACTRSESIRNGHIILATMRGFQRCGCCAISR